MKARQLLAYLAIKYQGDWEKIYDAILRKEDFDREEAERVVSEIKCDYVTLVMDANYPESLKHISKPPFVLFYYGDISLIKDEKKCLAVVGSRDYSSYGEAMTKNIISDLPSDSIIVSGMAIGIDTIAHKAAIESNKKTVAVLGSGIDYCYPKSNAFLYKVLKENDLVISEYPFTVEPDKGNFPIRNRIIAGLSWGVLVPEAKKQSGTSITVKLALDFGKEVMCVPTSANTNSLCNALIRSGAALVENAEDILDEKNF